jgi:hypothetical protein
VIKDLLLKSVRLGRWGLALRKVPGSESGVQKSKEPSDMKGYGRALPPQEEEE